MSAISFAEAQRRQIKYSYGYFQYRRLEGREILIFLQAYAFSVSGRLLTAADWLKFGGRLLTAADSSKFGRRVNFSLFLRLRVPSACNSRKS